MLKDKETVNKVLERLSKIVELPSEGLIAGGSVASILMEMSWGGEYPINDVDVFKPFRVPKNFTLGGVDTSTTFKGVERNSKYNIEKNRYGHLLVTSGNESGYKIVKTSNDGLLNTVEYEPLIMKNIPITLGTKPNFDVMNVIEGFDINCCQVGIDMKDKTLIYTPDFEEFLETRQLKVSTLYTPAHTAIRLVKKLDELKCYCDLETEMKLLSFMLTIWMREVTKSRVSFYFTEKYINLFEKYQKTLSNYFELFPFVDMQIETLERMNLPVTDDDRVRWEEYSDLKTLRAIRYVEDDKELENIFYNISLQPAIILKVFRYYRDNVKKVDKKKIDLLYSSYVTRKLLVIIKDFHKCDFSSKNVDYFERNITVFDFALDFMIKRQLNFQQSHDLIKDLKHAHNLNGDWILPAIQESLSDFILFEYEYEKDKFYKHLDKTLRRYCIDIIDPVDMSNVTFPEGVEIKEITSMGDLYKTGYEMKNCLRDVEQDFVERLLKKKIRLFKIKTEASVSAVELEIHNELYYSKKQLLSNCNKKPSELHQLIGSLLIHTLNRKILVDDIDKKVSDLDNSIMFVKGLMEQTDDESTKNNPVCWGEMDLFPNETNTIAPIMPDLTGLYKDEDDDLPL
jgi:hypothetical protein